MSNEIKEIAELIWSDLFAIANEGKSKEEQVKQIEERLQPALADAKLLGRRQVISHVEREINRLK